ncbi:nucleotidyltransferase family protein [Roseibium sp.]|uniref:nucleotidyltransferase family protein n=1 Tax=Roseibium sp. TaxID=1936156 RepID=UPI003A98686D
MPHPAPSVLSDPYATSEDQRIDALRGILRGAPAVCDILQAMSDVSAPDSWLVSGGIYQTVWNALTGRNHGHGIKDYDVIYFDGTDLSYEAEDEVITAFAKAVPALSQMLEVRNQARVHLWYEKRFGRPYAPLTCSLESLTTYAAKTHAVAVRIGKDGELEVHAPFGLANIFGLRLTPNHVMNNSATYREKAARMISLWPELTVVPWEQTAPAK